MGAADGGLEATAPANSKGNGSGWDQFAANERLFGLKTDYDENMYTTAIDRNHPNYKERMVNAEKKAREIERTVATTAHVAEERVMDFTGGKGDGEDEEDKWVARIRHYLRWMVC
jgi:PAB1-binding protein PBP1